MRKHILGFVIAACLLPFCVSFAYANEGYALSSREGLTDNILSLLSKSDNTYVLNHDPSTGYVDYVSWISYDYLSEMSVTWGSTGVLVYNPTMDAYFLVVSYVSMTSGSYMHCGLGTENGYIFGARANLSDSADTGVLTSIRAIINSMYDHVASINYALTREGEVFHLWMERLKIELELIELDMIQANKWLEKIDERLNMTNLNLQLIQMYITGHDTDGGLYGRLDDLIEAVSNLSVNVGGGTFSFDTTPITDKLQEVINSADANFSALFSDLGTHTDRIVAAIGDPVDLSPVNDRIDAVVEEVQKISTFADLHEVITVTPGVLGDVEVVTTGDWRYEDLTFYYEPVGGFVPDGSSEWVFNTDNLWVGDDGSASLEHVTWDYNSWGGTHVAISLTDEFFARMEDLPEFYLEFVESGGYTVFTVSSHDLLSGPLYYSVYSPADIFCIRIVIPSDAHLFKSAMVGWDVLTLKYGSFDIPMTSHLSFTVDGVPHTLYWWNEYEFVSDGTVWDGVFLRYTDGHWYLEADDGTVWPVVYYDAYLTDALTSAPTTTTTLEGETYTWFEWFYTSFKGGGGSLDVTPIVNKLKDIENALSNIGDSVDIENNTNININEGDENYNIFYVDDPDGGEDKSIVDLSGDTLTVFGKLLNFLYQVGFKGALNDAGGGIGDLSDFYLDSAEGSEDLWAS